MVFGQSLESYIQKLRESECISACEAVPVEEITDKQDFLFVSYSHHDYKKVFEDLAVMAHAGIKFWYDEGLRAGKHWDDEVKSILLHPRCAGVIFFISENLFLSKSVNQEIELVCDKNAPTGKPYFSVNLTDMKPGRIIRAVMRKPDDVLDEAGLDTERIADLAGAFSDRQTYLPFSAANHRDMLIREIKRQFSTVVGIPRMLDRMDAQFVPIKVRYLEVSESGDAILLKPGWLNIGREFGWADCHVKYPFAGRRHCSVICEAENTWILDHESLNGTFVNEVRVKPMEKLELKDGDVISMGSTKAFVFHVAEISFLVEDNRAGRTAPIIGMTEMMEKR